MRHWNRWKNESWFPYTVAACAGVTLYMILNNLDFFGNILSSVITVVKPLFYALILAYLMDPVARFYNNRFFSKVKNPRMGRTTSVILGVVSVVIVVALLGIGFFPPLVSSISNLFTNLYDYLIELGENSGDLRSLFPEWLASMLPDFNISSTVINTLTDFISNNLENIADTSASVGSGFANFMISFILAIYYMLDKERLVRLGKTFLRWLLKEKRYNSFLDFWTRADRIMLEYIKVSLFESLIVGAATAIFMAICRMPYVMLVAIVVGITNLVPVFGPVIGAIVGAIMIVIAKPVDVIVFLIFVIILQTIDGYILKPKLFGDSFGVSPLLILVMIIVGGRVMGMVGILLAIPFAAILQFVVDDVIRKKKLKQSAENS